MPNNNAKTATINGPESSNFEIAKEALQNANEAIKASKNIDLSNLQVTNKTLTVKGLGLDITYDGSSDKNIDLSNLQVTNKTLTVSGLGLDITYDGSSDENIDLSLLQVGGGGGMSNSITFKVDDNDDNNIVFDDSIDQTIDLPVIVDNNIKESIVTKKIIAQNIGGMLYSQKSYSLDDRDNSNYGKNTSIVFNRDASIYAVSSQIYSNTGNYYINKIDIFTKNDYGNYILNQTIESPYKLDVDAFGEHLKLNNEGNKLFISYRNNSLSKIFIYDLNLENNTSSENTNISLDISCRSLNINNDGSVIVVTDLYYVSPGYNDPEYDGKFQKMEAYKLNENNNSYEKFYSIKYDNNIHSITMNDSLIVTGVANKIYIHKYVNKTTLQTNNDEIPYDYIINGQNGLGNSVAISNNDNYIYCTEPYNSNNDFIKKFKYNQTNGNYELEGTINISQKTSDHSVNNLLVSPDNNTLIFYESKPSYFSGIHQEQIHIYDINTLVKIQNFTINTGEKYIYWSFSNDSSTFGIRIKSSYISQTLGYKYYTYIFNSSIINKFGYSMDSSEDGQYVVIGNEDSFILYKNGDLLGICNLNLDNTYDDKDVCAISITNNGKIIVIGVGDTVSTKNLVRIYYIDETKTNSNEIFTQIGSELTSTATNLGTFLAISKEENTTNIYNLIVSEYNLGTTGQICFYTVDINTQQYSLEGTINGSNSDYLGFSVDITSDGSKVIIGNKSTQKIKIYNFNDRSVYAELPYEDSTNTIVRISPNGKYVALNDLSSNPKTTNLFNIEDRSNIIQKNLTQNHNNFEVLSTGLELSNNYLFVSLKHTTNNNGLVDIYDLNGNYIKTTIVDTYYRNISHIGIGGINYYGSAIDTIVTNVYQDSTIFNLIPASNDTYDIGSSDLKWNNIHTNNIHSNDITSGNILPSLDDTYNLGSDSLKWNNIYATNNIIQTSDKKNKSNIIESKLGLEFINKLKPVSYQLNDGNRIHYGMIAQDVRDALVDSGFDINNENINDFAGYIHISKNVSEKEINEELEKYRVKGSRFNIFTKTKEEVEEYLKHSYGLRYTEFISPMIKSIQELSEENNNLKTTISSLEEKISKIESKFDLMKSLLN